MPSNTSVQYKESLFDSLFCRLANSANEHARDGLLWQSLSPSARAEAEKLFSSKEPAPIPFGPFGQIIFPYIAMGKITSLDLFGLDELILFAFYHRNRAGYRRVVDFGANIGLHSLILARCGYEVRSFEPDPHHFSLLTKNLALNAVACELHETAVSLKDGKTEFVRVLGNTTGSHIAGAKDKPYGELERFSVRVEAAAPHLAWADLAKIDIEGHEGDLITGLPTSTWQTTDALMEIGTPANAERIFNYLNGSGINMFAQKIGWQAISKLADMPTSHHEGSVFLSSKNSMPWNEA